MSDFDEKENEDMREELNNENVDIASQYADMVLSCRDCVTAFIFTAGEQAWFAAHNFAPPTRCSRCRAENKRQQGLTGLRPGTGALMLPTPRLDPHQGDMNQGLNMNTRRPATGPLGSYGQQPTQRSLTYRTHCRRCGGEAFVPYTGGRGNVMPLCRTCREQYES